MEDYIFLDVEVCHFDTLHVALMDVHRVCF